MSRYDYIYIHISHFKNLSEDTLEELNGLEFQTKDLDREFLEYEVREDGELYYEDYHYELVECDGILAKKLERVLDGIKKSNFTGIIVFYGKPYEIFYTFKAKITNGKLNYVRLVSKK